MSKKYFFLISNLFCLQVLHCFTQEGAHTQIHGSCRYAFSLVIAVDSWQLPVCFPVGDGGEFMAVAGMLSSW